MQRVGSVSFTHAAAPRLLLLLLLLLLRRAGRGSGRHLCRVATSFHRPLRPVAATAAAILTRAGGRAFPHYPAMTPRWVGGLGSAMEPPTSPRPLTPAASLATAAIHSGAEHTTHKLIATAFHQHAAADQGCAPVAALECARRSETGATACAPPAVSRHAPQQQHKRQRE